MHTLFMFSRNVYATQPYLVGSKGRKSLAIIIPARLVKEYDVNTSTIFAVRAEKRTNRIIMYTVHGQSKDNMMDVMEASFGEKPYGVAGRIICD
jgi:antitoxin component of MazEF toxin-antitoxin module